MYRSFLTCDDPKGVVGCGTIRKYRTCSHKMKDKTKVQKRDEHLETSLMNKRYNKEEKFPKGTDGSLIGPSSMQLSQVSRGDQSLNNMIDSWSRDLIYGEKSEDIAQHILKGALDLQDSLIMLRKLQEASQHTTPFRRKQTEKLKRDTIDAKMIGKMQANPFSEQSNPKGLQSPQPCAGGSSSNCKEELKKVIKESLVRQNMFPTMTTEGLNSASETFSTSPSHSSGVRTNSISDPSFSVIAPKVERGPSLVVKLMGLEEPPSRSFPSVMQKQLDGEKIMNQKRPIFDIDMSKVAKNDFIAEKISPEEKAPRETLDTMHFKGLLNKSFVKEHKLQVHHLNHPNSKQIMKTQCTLYQESVKTPTREELSMRKLKAEIVYSKNVKHRKGSSSTNMVKEMEKGETKRLNKEEEPKFLKEVVKPDAKGIILPIEASSGKVKLYCHTGYTSRVNETIDKKWKVQTISRKQPENARHQYQREITTPTKLRKSKSRSTIDKAENSHLKSTGSDNISISKTEAPGTNNSKELNMEIKNFDSVVDSLILGKNQMKNHCPVSEPKPAKLIVDQIKQGIENKTIDVPGKEDFTEIRMANTVVDELLMVCEADACTKWKVNKCSSSNDIMLLNSEHENDSTLAEEAHENTKCSEADDSINHDQEGTELKHFLLTSESFIGHAKQFFNLDWDWAKILQKGETNYGMDNLRLYLDYANEVIELKSLQESQVVCSFLLACRGDSRLHISLGKLVEEIYNAIENLKFYNEKPFAGNVFAIMEKDMKCNGVINSMWERGWRHGFSADEAELVVNKIETLLLIGLIEELIINL
ncbi:uncharacterized protein LOC113855785 [Abrus precatorius]|uniref:Uncharacterized protein LOC113855785 n=1 Tax=Abrus precatorius TaxID=3816 RepID=A0A8B8KIX9_ABRPR|nr:uncharacterized protein LOC113855785 [Abrus precatorius]